MKGLLPILVNNAGFYLARLRRASPTELFCRLGHARTRRRVGRLTRRGRLPCALPPMERSLGASLEVPEFFGEVDGDVAGRILSGFRFTLGADPADVGILEREACRLYLPPIRNAGGGADVRAVWEPARLQHLTLLLASLRQSPRAPRAGAIATFVREELLSWLTGNPFPLGLHYVSAMECGLRVPVFLYALKVLDGLDDSAREALLGAMYLHAWWIANNLSLHSSLGNHTVCEALGLVFAGAVFRGSPAGGKWLAKGISLLERELDHQILPDGGPVEQSFSYHRFVLDLYWLAADFLERNGLRRCDDFRERLVKGEHFLAAFRDGSGNLPAIGDSDDGHALAPGLSPRRSAPELPERNVTSFRESGYTVVRWSGDSLLTFDHGPLGMAPLYNHGHADALSITLSVGGIPFLVDPGTYRYNGVPAYRRYFKGTRAHSTVTIDGRDQAEQLTGFVWGSPFHGRLEQVEETSAGLQVEASHDGYLRLGQPVRHIRSISFPSDGTCIITDRFSGRGEHEFELNFHLHPEVTVAPRGGGWLAERNGRRLGIELEGGNFRLRSGEEAPPLGWFSQAYNRKVPAPALQASRFGEAGMVSYVTRITIER